MKGKSVIGVGRQMVNGVAILSLLFCSLSVNAKKITSTPTNTAVIVSHADSKHRICYYNDKAFSIGAIIEVSGVVIQCVAENDFETNGTLSWVEMKKKDE
ncbi:YnjH family protein [Vibrio artabrorum]|uniref:YnjH family protein n=1 Tax=Vibrio artabrorum TaxID=446374 RepID=UPI0021C304FA|nr:YnjH family protein [Vibrio artabrorum]